MSAEFRDLGLFEANSGIVDYTLQARRDARDKPVSVSDIALQAGADLVLAASTVFGTVVDDLLPESI